MTAPGKERRLTVTAIRGRIGLSLAPPTHTVCSFVPGLPSPPLVASEVHVVLFQTGTETDAAAFDWLGDRERARASRFVRRSHARCFIETHAMVRFVLGRCLEVAPASLRFTRGSHGKPALQHAGIDLRFNFSHSGERALLAVTIGRDVGVDIERHRHIDFAGLANRYFSIGERRALAALPADDRLKGFYRCWARKESFIKARGDGLSFPLEGFEVSLTPESELVACPAAPADLHRWSMASLPVDEGYTAALTVEGRGWQPRLWK